MVWIFSSVQICVHSSPLASESSSPSFSKSLNIFWTFLWSAIKRAMASFGRRDEVFLAVIGEFSLMGGREIWTSFEQRPYHGDNAGWTTGWRGKNGLRETKRRGARTHWCRPRA